MSNAWKSTGHLTGVHVEAMNDELILGPFKNIKKTQISFQRWQGQVCDRATCFHRAGTLRHLVFS